MFKSIVLLLALAASAAVLVVPLSPLASATPGIVVTGRSMDVFTRDVTRDLQSQLSRTPLPYRMERTGIVSVRFHATPQGGTRDLTIHRSSGTGVLDRTAQRAVLRMSSFAPLPAGIRESDTFQANIVFANSESESERLQRRFEKTEANRLRTAGTKGHAVLAFGVTSAVSRP